MSAAPRHRQRRSSSRDRTPRHVDPVLDPNWQSPYSPSAEERDVNRRAIRTISLERIRPWLLAAAVVFVASVAISVAGIWVSSIAGWWWPLVGLAALAGAAASYEARCRRLERSVTSLADDLLGAFSPGGTSIDAQRLATIVDRLGATFGLSDVLAKIVSDEGYNAALLPGESHVTLLVTSSLMANFDLIEIEGVVAHLMARQRLALLERTAAASQSRWDIASAHALAGSSSAYRADEVAAAGIRYPLGIARALEKCAARTPPTNSFFATPRYAATRWVWFDVYADHLMAIPADLDRASVRALALHEW